MTKILLVILLSGVSIISCNSPQETDYKKSSDSSLEKQNELLKQELELQQKELELQQKQFDSSNKPNEQLSISKLYKQVKKGVFLVYTTGNNFTNQGSGFFINNSGTAVSNYHVFENANNGIVYSDDGNKYMITKIIDYSKELDYVIFQVGDGSNSFTALNISTELPDIGEQCFAVGNPEGLTQTLSIGNISSYRNGNKLIQITTPITHGSSGGPLFNSKGEVIGITSSGMDEADLNFAINIHNIPSDKYQNQQLTIGSLEEELPTNEIKQFIIKYYSATFNRDYASLQNFYAPILDRFFTNFNFPSAKAIEQDKNYWSAFKITSAHNNINWNTLKITKLSDGTFSVQFNMNYFIERVDKNKPKSFNEDINIIITSDMKIKSIYENILNKH